MRFTKQLLLAFMLLFLFSCNKDDEGAMQEENLAELITSEVTDINLYSVTIGGKLVNSGDSEVTEVGFVIGVASAPRVENHLHKYIVTQNQAGEFTKTITGLDANTTYYLRSYAINTEGIGYGNEIEFRTPEERVFRGNIILQTQEEVEEFGANNYTTIEGDLTITGTVSELLPLESLAIVVGDLNIEDNDVLQSLNGLDNLVYIERQLMLYVVSELTNINSLGNLAVVNRIEISGNNNLESLIGLENIVALDFLRINGNGNLTNLRGLENLKYVGDLDIYATNLINLNGFENLETVESIYIYLNRELINLTGLENLKFAEKVFIKENHALMGLSGLNELEVLRDVRITENNILENLNGLNGLNSSFDLFIEGNPSLNNLIGFGDAKVKRLYIENNSNLLSLEGLENVDKLESLEIENNDLLENLNGLNGLTSITGSEFTAGFLLNIINNNNLNSLDGLENLVQVDGYVRVNIYNQPNLSDLCALKPLLQTGFFSLSCSNQINYCPDLIEDILINCP